MLSSAYDKAKLFSENFSENYDLGDSSTAKNYCPVSVLSVVSKVFEKLVNNRIVDQLEKCGLFYDFQYGFRYSRSTADLLTVLSAAMGIRKKIRRQFCFYFCHRKGQIRQHYNGKKF